MTNRTYIGLTIGPIIETISNAKETGELWASSYLFSYIMKNIIKKLIEDENLKNRFILPCIDNILKEKQEVGLFHDRFIFESKKGDFDLVKEAVNRVIEDIVIEIKKYKPNKSNKEIRNNIDDFLKIYYLEVDVDINENEDIKKEKNDNNIIFKVNKSLDALELREKVLSENGMKKNYILETLNNKELKEKITKHFLVKDAYGEKGKEIEYPSLFKIALGKTYDKEFPNEDNDIRKKINKSKKLIKANEYVAIVQADGDSMGEVISNFKINKKDLYKDYKDFSKKLLKYDEESHRKIKDYKGLTVYAGGDDLLFIAPIINEEKNNIFNLIDELSKIFDSKFEKEYKPTTSFGIAMVHHKFPLYYALDEARDLLFNEAKNYEFNNSKKNAIAFKVIKSSGQSFETVVGKSSESYKQFKALFESVSSTIDAKDDSKIVKNYLKAIHFKLMRDKVLLNKIGRDKKKLENYFYNNFDEKIHKTEPIKSYIEKLIEFIYKIYEESTEKMDNDKCINQIYTYLRFIKFMDEDINLNND